MRFWPRSRQSLPRSFLNAFRGLKFAFEGRNFVVTLIVGFLVLATSYVLRLDTEDRFIIVISTGAILGAEIFNTAIEKLLDHLSPTEHPEVGKVKDLLAAGVLVFSIIAMVIWARLFLKAVLGWSV